MSQSVYQIAFLDLNVVHHVHFNVKITFLKHFVIIGIFSIKKSYQKTNSMIEQICYLIKTNSKECLFVLLFRCFEGKDVPCLFKSLQFSCWKYPFYMRDFNLRSG